MRIFFRVVLIASLFYSVSAWSANAWENYSTRTSWSDPPVPPSQTFVDTCAAISSPYVAWRIDHPDPNHWYCQRNTQPCDAPQVWDQINFQCRLPCESGKKYTRNFSPIVNVICVSGCEVTQTGDSSCTGTAAEGGTCVAEFTQSGNFCPAAPDNSTPTETGSSSSSGTGGDTGGGDTGGGTGGTGGTGGNTGGTTSSAGSGDTGGGTGGTGSTSSSGSGSGSGDNGTGTGSVTGGYSCDAPPECVAGPDSVSCGILFQEWRQRCPSTDLLTLEGDYFEGSHELDIDQRVAQAQEKYAQRFNEIQSDLSDLLSLSVSGGGNITCNPVTIFGQTIDLSICARMDFLLLIQGLFFAIAAILSVYIILGR